MSKKPRPSINDQLAQIAAKAPPPSNVATLPRETVLTLLRDDVKPDNVGGSSACRPC